MGHPRVAVAELPQVGPDAQAGVLEQVLVDRSLPGDGHELFHPRPGNRISLETDGDLRAGPDVQLDRHRQPVRARHGGVGEARRVEPPGPDLVLVLRKAAIELDRIVGVPFPHAEPVQDDGPLRGLEPADLDASDARRRARIDVDDEPAVRRRRPRRDARREPAGVAIELVEEGRGGVDLVGRHPAPQPAPDEIGRLLDGTAAGVEHLQPARAAERHQVVAQADASAPTTAALARTSTNSPRLNRWVRLSRTCRIDSGWPVRVSMKSSSEGSSTGRPSRNSRTSATCRPASAAGSAAPAAGAARASAAPAAPAMRARLKMHASRESRGRRCGPRSARESTSAGRSGRARGRRGDRGWRR